QYRSQRKIASNVQVRSVVQARPTSTLLPFEKSRVMSCALPEGCKARTREPRPIIAEGSLSSRKYVPKNSFCELLYGRFLAALLSDQCYAAPCEEGVLWEPIMICVTYSFPATSRFSMIKDLWYKNAVIYCLSVSTYMDANGDGIGDFQGLMRRLDYLD